MTTEHVSWSAACPWCGIDALWRSTREPHRIRIDCPTCGDSDPVASLAAVITNRQGAQA